MEEMFDSLTEQMTRAEGISKQLKEENQLMWVAEINAVRERVVEIVNYELIRA